MKDYNQTLQSALAKLQNQFAEIDLLSGHASPRGMSFLVKKLLEITIRMDGNKNHMLPHVHVDYGPDRHAASFAIESGERLAGVLNRKYDVSAREWISTNKTVLLEVWKVTQSGGDPQPFVATLKAG